MKVTNVRLERKTNSLPLMACGSITLDDEFIVSGIKVLMSKDGEFYVDYPSWRNSDGKYKNVCYPKEEKLREYIQECVLKACESI